MKAIVGKSAVSDVEAALNEACLGMGELRPNFILFFCDEKRLALFAQKFKVLFPDVPVMGSSTYASFTPGAYSHESISVAAFVEGVRVQAGVIGDIATNPSLHLDKIRETASFVGPLERDQCSTCCLVLNPAGLAAEELVLDTLEDALEGTNIPVFGGSASSEVCGKGSVSLDGVVYPASSVYVILHLDSGKFVRYQENIFHPLGKKHRVTKADVENRTIYELDGHPISHVLCREFGVTPDKLPETLALHPFGRIAGSRLFTSEIEKVNPDGSVTTFCRTFNQTDIYTLHLGDSEAETKKTLEDIHSLLARIDFSLLVNCYSRVQLYEKRGWIDTFNKEMGTSLSPYIGLTSHGEQLDDYLLNLTLLILAFGEE